MKIKILGTGTSQGIPVVGCKCEVCTSNNPKDERLRVSVHITLDTGLKILIDTSPDLRQQLLKNKITEVDAILVTHEHNDHIIGLDDIRPINFLQKKVLPLYANERVIKVIRSKFDYAFGPSPYPGAPRLETNIIDTEDVKIQDVAIQVIKIWHGKLPILAFRVNDFAYVTDIKSIEASEIQKLHNLEVLVIGALRLEEHHSHMSLSDVLELVELVKPRQTFLTHISHNFGTHDGISAMLPPNVRVAYDQQLITIP